MPAFKNNHAYAIANTITQARDRVFRISQLHLSHQDFLELFVPHEQREMYSIIGAVAMVPKTGAITVPWVSSYGDKLNLRFHVQSVDGSPMPPIPRNPTLGDANPRLVERINNWLANGAVNVTVDFPRVQACFNKLNELCASPAAMRFFWPTTTALCSMSDNPELKSIADDITAMKVPSKIPPLPSGMAVALRKAAATITMAQLVPTEVTEVRPAVSVSLAAPNDSWVTEPGIGNFYCH